jgi:hypothetical protein
MWRGNCRLGVYSFVAVLAVATSGLAGAAPSTRTMTVTKSYTLANLFTTDQATPLTAVAFPAPGWARTAVVTVHDQAGPIIYWARWSQAPATLNCSVADGAWNGTPTAQTMDGRGGQLLIAPASDNAWTGVTTAAQPTFKSCPDLYSSVVTAGTVTVTFSSGRHH